MIKTAGLTSRGRGGVPCSRFSLFHPRVLCFLLLAVLAVYPPPVPAAGGGPVPELWSPSPSTGRSAQTASPCKGGQKLTRIEAEAAARNLDQEVHFPFSLADHIEPQRGVTSRAFSLCLETPQGPGAHLTPLGREVKVEISGTAALVRIRDRYRYEGAGPAELRYEAPALPEMMIHRLRIRLEPDTKEKPLPDRDLEREYQNPASFFPVSHGGGEGMRFRVQSGQTIHIALMYSQILHPVEGTYRFVLPPLPGPCVSPGADGSSPAEGTHPSFEASLALNTGIPLRIIDSPTHRVSIYRPTRDSAYLRMLPGQQGDREWVVEYRLAGDRIQSGLLLYDEGEDHYFMVHMEPPASPLGIPAPPREFIFVIDVSRSMSGYPLAAARYLMKRLFLHLNPSSDYLNLVLFGGAARVLGPEGSLPASAANIQKALSWVHSPPPPEEDAGLYDALARAAALPRPPAGTTRCIVLITDGYVTVRRRLFTLVRALARESSFSVFGVGVGVNRTLIAYLARTAGGVSTTAVRPDRVKRAADAFRRAVETPLVVHPTLTYEGLQIYDVLPLTHPDLMASAPLVIVGKYCGDRVGRIRIAGASGTDRYVETLTLRPWTAQKENAPIRYYWARKWLEVLRDRRRIFGAAPELDQALSKLRAAYTPGPALFMETPEQPVPAGPPNPRGTPAPGEEGNNPRNTSGGAVCPKRTGSTTP